MRDFGSYQVLEELGSGAMAVVWLAYDPALDRQVAIKELRPQAGTRDSVAAEMSARFIHEARTVARLEHPGIVTVYAAGDFDGRAAIVMELLSGETLGQILARGPVEPTSVQHVIAQLLDAIGHAHSAGVIHRDVKPDNIFVLNTGRVKITDFGVAHLVDSGMTQMGTVIGTPGYMSPEQVRGDAVTAQSDLFSVGVVAYELLTGINPFGRFPDHSPHTIMYRIVEQDVTVVSKVAPDVPRAMSDTIRVLLAKSSAERPVDAFQALRMWQDLERVKPAPIAFPLTGLLRPKTIEPPLPTVVPSVAGSATVIAPPTPEDEDSLDVEPLTVEHADTPVHAADITPLSQDDTGQPQDDPEKAAHDESEDGLGQATAGTTPEPDDEGVSHVSDPEPAAPLAVDEPDVSHTAPRRRMPVAAVVAVAAAIGVGTLAWDAMSSSPGTKSAETTAPTANATPVRAEQTPPPTSSVSGEPTATPSAEPVIEAPKKSSARIGVNDKRVPKGTAVSFTLSGTSDGEKLDGLAALLEWRKNSSGKWSLFPDAALELKDGKATRRMKIPTGTHQFRTRLLGNEEYDGASSSAVTVTCYVPKTSSRRSSSGGRSGGSSGGGTTPPPGGR